MPRHALCIGSTTKDVKTTTDALNIFWNHLLKDRPLPMPALATGEVGDHMWSKRQLDFLKGLPQVRVIREGKFEETGRYIHAPLMRVRKGATISADDLRLFFNTRFDEANSEFTSFCKSKGVDLPQLVGINTIDILLLAFGWQLGTPTKLLDAFIERTRIEAAEIWRKSRGNVVFMIESPMANILSNLTHGNKNLTDWLLTAFLRLIRALPEGAEWILHLCYGRVGNNGMFKTLRKVIFKPKYTANFLMQLLEYLQKYGLAPVGVHLPFRHGSHSPSTNPREYRVYADITLPPSVQVFAGAIDPGMDLRNQRAIYDMLDHVFEQTVGVGPTCGFGSTTRRDMEQTLKRMYEVAHVL